MPGHRWGEFFGWRPSFDGILGAFSRTGCFTNNIHEPRLGDNSDKPSRLLKAARSLTTLTAAAAVGLEIILHDVNVDKVPGVVTRVNLQDALDTITHPHTIESTSSMDATGSSHSLLEEEQDDYDSEDNFLDYSLCTLLISTDVQESMGCQEYPVHLEVKNPDALNDYQMENAAHLSDSEEADQVQQPAEGERALQLQISKSYGHRKPTWFDMFGAFQPKSCSTSLPNQHFWGHGELEEELPYFTCQKATYGDVMIPVPDSHAWRWFNLDEVDVFDERVLGEGTYSNVFQASIAFYTENVDNYIVRSVAVKAFIAGGVDIESIIYEADISSYMASVGVGPDTLGLLNPVQDENYSLPSLLMVYIEGSLDLETLFTSSKKPSRNVVVDILIQAARLLKVIHSHGFLHNDIKCCNMIVTPNPLHHGAAHYGVPPPAGITGHLTPYSKYRVFLIDFGQTTYKEGAVYDIPASELAKFGHYPYLPPEVLDGAPTCVASEIYSFGMLLKSSCSFLEDLDLKSDMLPIIDMCLSTSPADRPSFQDVECWLVALLPHQWQRRYSEMGFSTDPSDNCESQSSGCSIGPFPSGTTVPSTDSSSDFEIRVVPSLVSKKSQSDTYNLCQDTAPSEPEALSDVLTKDSTGDRATESTGESETGTSEEIQVDVGNGTDLTFREIISSYKPNDTSSPRDIDALDKQLESNVRFFVRHCLSSMPPEFLESLGCPIANGEVIQKIIDEATTCTPATKDIDIIDILLHGRGYHYSEIPNVGLTRKEQVNDGNILGAIPEVLEIPY